MVKINFETMFLYLLPIMTLFLIESSFAELPSSQNKTEGIISSVEELSIEKKEILESTITSEELLKQVIKINNLFIEMKLEQEKQSAHVLGLKQKIDSICSSMQDTDKCTGVKWSSPKERKALDDSHHSSNEYQTPNEHQPRKEIQSLEEGPFTIYRSKESRVVRVLATEAKTELKKIPNFVNCDVAGNWFDKTVNAKNKLIRKIFFVNKDNHLSICKFTNGSWKVFPATYTRSAYLIKVNKR